MRVLTVVAVYSADGVRDPAMNGAIGAALMAGPARWQGVNRLRRDARAGGLVLAAPRFVLFFRYVILSGSHDFKTAAHRHRRTTAGKE